MCNKLETLKKDIESITGLAYFNSNELITLCPNCEKERFNTNRNHGHLYISTELPIFKCFRCDFKGMIYKLLSKFGLTEINKYYDESQLKFEWKSSDYDKFVDKQYNDNIQISKDLNSYGVNLNEKKQYVKNRIKFYTDIENDPNIIYNIKQFIKENNINLNKDESFLNFIDSNFVGFLCTRNSLLICRNIDTLSSFRYFKIELKNIYFKDFYSKRLNNNSRKIAMCEGIFDLYNLISNPVTKNLLQECSIITTALNNDYKSTLISTLDYIKSTYADVIIFSDKDLTEDRYMNVYFNNSVNSLNLYYNEYDKDFGTDKISLVKIPIKRYYKKDY